MGRPKGCKLTPEHREKIRLSLLGNKRAHGNKFSDEARARLCISRAGKGNAMYGKHHSEETKRKIALANSGKQMEKNPNWKGDDVGYQGIHKWIRKYVPKPETCEMCHENKRLLAACVTGVYNRDPKNFKYICYKCHNHMDGTVNNLKLSWKRIKGSISSVNC